MTQDKPGPGAEGGVPALHTGLYLQPGHIPLPTTTQAAIATPCIPGQGHSWALSHTPNPQDPWHFKAPASYKLVFYSPCGAQQFQDNRCRKGQSQLGSPPISHPRQHTGGLHPACPSASGRLRTVFCRPWGCSDTDIWLTNQTWAFPSEISSAHTMQRTPESLPAAAASSSTPPPHPRPRPPGVSRGLRAACGKCWCRVGRQQRPRSRKHTR